MFAGSLTQATLRALDWLAARTLSPEDSPAHQRTGRRGEVRKTLISTFAGGAIP